MRNPLFTFPFSSLVDLPDRECLRIFDRNFSEIGCEVNLGILTEAS